MKTHRWKELGQFHKLPVYKCENKDCGIVVMRGQTYSLECPSPQPIPDFPGDPNG